MAVERQLLSGNQALALAAQRAGVQLASGYPGTPSTEILELFSELGGPARWAPNEKVALEVALGAAFAGARALCTMKHVGLNVAADPLFTAAYSGVPGALVLVVCDDPGLHSSQNEQDTRRLAIAAGVPLLEPADSQQCFDLLLDAFAISGRWRIPVILRPTTRVCHSQSVVLAERGLPPPAAPHFARDIANRVMIPAHARPAHRRLRAKLGEIAAWNDAEGPIREWPGDAGLGIVSAGIAALHAREAAPGARLLQLACTHPLPLERIRRFAASVQRLVAVEENDPVLVEQLRAAGIAVEAAAPEFRFGELTVERVRRQLAGDASPEPAAPRGRPPQLCQGCPYRTVFTVFQELDCIVAGDIGCYTLGALPPFSAMDSQLCMGASIPMGLGMRRVLPEAEARRVLSVIGDSTFMHSGLTGLAEMVYNPPASGHVVVLLDNGTTAMTGRQEHPGTGRSLDHSRTGKVQVEKVAAAMGLDRVEVLELDADGHQRFKALLAACLAKAELSLIVVRRPCLLAAKFIREYEQRDQQCGAGCDHG